jgi:uncharacterized protein YbjQ (UPF0145 family)
MEFLIVILIFGGFFFFFIYLPTKSKKKKATSTIANSSSEIKQLRDKVLVVTSSSIPGKEITNVLGNVTGTSKTTASTPEESEAAEKEAMISLMYNAIDMGANAVIDLKMTTSSFEAQGSKWMVSKTFYNGTAVTIR